jgi:hypothetical protein
MCFLLRSIHLHGVHLILHLAICAFNQQFVRELLGRTDLVHQMMDTTITIRKGEGELQNVMAEPMNEWSHYITFSRTTAAHSLLDCTHSNSEHGIEQVYTFENSCPAHASASKEFSPINSKRSRESILPNAKPSKRAPGWKQHLSRRILHFVGASIKMYKMMKETPENASFVSSDCGQQRQPRDPKDGKPCFSRLLH